MTRLLEGRSCIISGVGGGTGRAVALAFAREGASVLLACRTEATGAAIAQEVAATGARVESIAADITKAEDRERIVSRAASAFGGIDVLVNNAFATGKGGLLEKADIAKNWRTPFEVNVFGTLLMSQAVLPAMKERGGGSIVMVGTLAARKAELGLAAYGASKAALLSAAQGLAKEVGRHQIRVNTVVPSYIDGPHLRVYFKSEAARLGKTEEDVYKGIAANTALGRLATSEQVADAVLFFASSMSHAITGQSLDVNCGEWFV